MLTPQLKPLPSHRADPIRRPSPFPLLALVLLLLLLLLLWEQEQWLGRCCGCG
jgi:hypothetical protein